MKRQLPYLAGALLGAASPAAAQVPWAPWTPVTTTPPPPAGYAYPTTALLQLPGKTGVWAVRTSNGYRGAYQTDVLASADNGLSWRVFSTNFSSSPSPSGARVADLQALDGQRAWLILFNYATSTTQLYQTTTGPPGFAVAPAQVPGNVQRIYFFDASTGLALTAPTSGAASWLLYRTTTGGQSWQLVSNLPAAAAATQAGKIAGLGPDFWLTTQPGPVVHTADMGLTWTVGTAPQALAAPAFRDAQHGLATALATGAGRPLYRTADGGATWTLLAPTGPRGRYAMAAVPGSPGTYLSVGNDPMPTGIIDDQPGTAISYDEGQTWLHLGGDSGSWMDGLATDATGRLWTAFYGTGTLAYLPSGVLAAASPQAAAPTMYPSPTTGLVHLPAAGAYRQVAVYDAAGRQCRLASLGPTETTLDLASLGAGLYLLRLTGGRAAPRQQRVVVAP